MFDFLNERNKTGSMFRAISGVNHLNIGHPRCLGDGVDSCGYDTKIDCEECKFNNAPYGRKDPAAKCNQHWLS
jgi:hypothetical protein